MKIIKSEGRYQVFTDGIETFDVLPPRSYHVMFDENRGFYLSSAEDVKNTEKVYGNLHKRVDKVFKAYEAATRSVGILMSGRKGIGKTMMARIICERANQMGLPVIMVSFNKPGLAHFLGTITQPALVLFDEFEKMFSSSSIMRSDGDDEGAGGSPAMLSLLDGLYNSKWLFVFTCNHTHRISDYLMGRPGRIHYHFKFNEPNDDEIREYLTDNIPEDKYDQIQEVIAFSRYAEINYDALRAIAFEFKLGNDFRDFIGDLNIDRKFVSCKTYMFVTFKNGMVVAGCGGTINVYEGRDKHSWSLGGYREGSNTAESKRLVEFIFDEKHIVADRDSNDGSFIINPEYISKCIARDASPTEIEKPVIAAIGSGIESVRIIPDTDEFDALIDEWKDKTVTYKEEEKDGSTTRTILERYRRSVPSFSASYGIGGRADE